MSSLAISNRQLRPTTSRVRVKELTPFWEEPVNLMAKTVMTLTSPTTATTTAIAMTSFRLFFSQSWNELGVGAAFGSSRSNEKMSLLKTFFVQLLTYVFKKKFICSSIRLKSLEVTVLVLAVSISKYNSKDFNQIDKQLKILKKP